MPGARLLKATLLLRPAMQDHVQDGSMTDPLEMNAYRFRVWWLRVVTSRTAWITVNQSTGNPAAVADGRLDQSIVATVYASRRHHHVGIVVGRDWRRFRGRLDSPMRCVRIRHLWGQARAQSVCGSSGCKRDRHGAQWRPMVWSCTVTALDCEFEKDAESGPPRRVSALTCPSGSPGC